MYLESRERSVSNKLPDQLTDGESGGPLEAVGVRTDELRLDGASRRVGIHVVRWYGCISCGVHRDEGDGQLRASGYGGRELWYNGDNKQGGRTRLVLMKACLWERPKELLATCDLDLGFDKQRHGNKDIE